MTDGSSRTYVIRRSRALRALTGDAGAPMRLLCAPIGSGVTIALREYARTHAGVAFVSLRQEHAKRTIADILRSSRDAREVLIDDADRLPREAFDTLVDFALRPHAPKVLIAGHARTRMRVHTLVAAGDAELLDASALTFDTEETVQLAAALGVDADRGDIAEVLYQTDGWAVVLAWLLRDAARQGRSLCGAFEIWAENNAHLLREFIDGAVDGAAAPEAQTLDRVCAAQSYDDVQAELSRLDVLGYPVVRTRQGLRPYRVLQRIAGQPREVIRADPEQRLAITLLGQFSARIGEREVEFVRRRDRNVLIYVALSPCGKVSRRELAETFWPGVPPAISSQGIRTTLSRLRHAIATAAGRDADRYLRSGPIVALDLDHVGVDARRFAEHVTQGRLAEERGDAAGAWHHYVFAQRLRGADLLRSEPIEPALESLVERFSELAHDLSARTGAVGTAHTADSAGTESPTLVLHGALT